MHKHDKNSYASATPACDGEHVFATFLYDGALWVTAVTLDGKIAWQVAAGPFKAEHGDSASPVLYKSALAGRGRQSRIEFCCGARPYDWSHPLADESRRNRAARQLRQPDPRDARRPTAISLRRARIHGELRPRYRRAACGNALARPSAPVRRWRRRAISLSPAAAFRSTRSWRFARTAAATSRHRTSRGRRTKA